MQIPFASYTSSGFLARRLSGKYSGAVNYFEYALPAIKEMVRQTGKPVFDENGIPCHVVAKSPVDDTEKAYKLTFKDGTSIIAGERHLWNCQYIYGKRKDVLWTTGEIYRRTSEYRQRFSDRETAVHSLLCCS